MRKELTIQGLHKASFGVLYHHGHLMIELILGVKSTRTMSDIQWVSIWSSHLRLRYWNICELSLSVFIDHWFSFLIEDRYRHHALNTTWNLLSTA